MTFKAVLVFLAVFAAARLLGAIGFPQIVGSLQQFKPVRLFTIVLWLTILSAGWYAVHRYLSGAMITLYLGYGWSLIDTLHAGRIS